MKTVVRVHGIEMTDEFKENVERRIAFAVNRFAGSLQEVAVYIVDLNGPKGGVDKLCHIAVTLAGSDRIMILEVAPEVLDSVKRAARRLRTCIRRELRRRHRPPARIFRESIRACEAPA